MLLDIQQEGFEDIQQYLEKQDRDEARRIQNQIDKIDRFMERQRRATQIEEQRIDKELQSLRSQLDTLEGVRSKWQTQSRRERRLGIQKSIQDLVERRTELKQETIGSLEELFMEKIELERELEEIQSSNTYDLI